MDTNTAPPLQRSPLHPDGAPGRVDINRISPPRHLLAYPTMLDKVKALLGGGGAPQHSLRGGEHMVKQPSRKPVKKVAAAGAGGALAPLIIVVGELLGVDIPPEVAAGAATALSFAAGYFKEA